MSTLVIIGSSETRFVARDGGQPWMLTPRSLRGLSMRVDPGQDSVEIVEGFGLGRGWPAHNDDFDRKRARRLDLGVGRASAAVFCHQRVDPLAVSSARVHQGQRTDRAQGSACDQARRRRPRADRSLARCSDVAALARTRRAAADPGSEKPSSASVPRAVTASSIAATSIQRSPGSRVQGGRVNTTSGVPVAPQAATALADMREAKGWVASTTASMCSRVRNAAKPSAPPKPPMR